MELTPALMKRLVDEKLNMVDVLRKHNPDEHYEVNQQCYCPFHDNQNSKAANIYEDDETGQISLYCFAEKVPYFTSDVLDILMKKDVYLIADKVWNKMTESQRKSWFDSHSHSSYEDMFSTTDEKEKVVDKDLEIAKSNFRSGKQNISDLMGAFLKSK
jgi:hypothetical protein